MRVLLSSFAAIILLGLQVTETDAAISFTTTEAGFFTGPVISFDNSSGSGAAPYTDPVSGIGIEGSGTYSTPSDAIMNDSPDYLAFVVLPTATSRFAFDGILALTAEFEITAYSDSDHSNPLGSMAFAQSARGDEPFVGVVSTDGDIRSLSFQSTGAAVGGSSPSFFIEDLRFQSAIPEPAAVTVWSVLGLSLLVGRLAMRRRSRPPTA